MVLAPHPDDESVAHGVIIQHAVAAGAEVHIAYLTDGENNPWPMRVVHRRWTITDADKRAWAEVRRSESREACRTLGVSAARVRFLHLPDSGLTSLFTKDPQTIVSELTALLDEIQPTWVLSADPRDLHADHNTAAAALRLAEAHCARSGRKSWQTLSAVVHTKPHVSRRHSITVVAAPEQVSLKRRAIGEHKTQMVLSSDRFLGYARTAECYEPFDAAWRSSQAAAILNAALIDGHLRLSVNRVASPILKLLLPNWQRSLHAVANLGDDEHRCAGAVFPLGRARSDEALALPFPSSPSRVLLKIDDRPIFLDESGWIEIFPKV